MSEIGEIIKDLNLPKHLLDKSEAILKTLFGPTFEEFGGLISDQEKLRRFKNQLTIFEKAQKILKEKNLNPKKVSLKVLAPLIEYSSYEEEENLQEKWANLTATILDDNSDVLFQQNSITILNRISSEDAKLLDYLHGKLAKSKQERYQKQLDHYEKYKDKGSKSSPPNDPSTYSLDSFTFSVTALSKEINLQIDKLEYCLSNLISLGLLKWETDVEVSAKKWNTDPDDDSIDVDVSVYNNTDFIFTPLGEKFVRKCNGK